jgi:hypothetical protein
MRKHAVNSHVPVVSFRVTAVELDSLKAAGLNPAVIAKAAVAAEASKADFDQRMAFIAAFARRGKPSGLTAAQLVREARDELVRRAERHVRR